MLIEKLWLKLSAIKWPTLVVGSEDYNMRRKAFFMGCMTTISIIVRATPKALDILIPKMGQELRAELQRADSEIVSDIAKN